MDNLTVIPPRSGIAFTLEAGKKLQIVDIQGEQVSDFVTFNASDIREYLSSGRTIDYNNKIFLTQGDKFYSNRSRVMFEIIDDTVGRHDFLLTPCSKDTFSIIYGDTNPHQGCEGNLQKALAPYGISVDSIPVCFNVFMHVAVNGETGAIDVMPPKSKAGDSITILSHMNLIVGITACSAGMSNNFSFKPIGYKIFDL